MKKLFTVVAAVSLAGAGCFSPAPQNIQPAPVAPAPAPSAAVTEPLVDVQPTSTEKSPTAEATTTKKDDTTKSETITAVIQNYAYVPAIISVKKGTKIVFTNKDSVGHTVTADNGAFRSQLLKQDYIFELSTGGLEKGSYPFHCEPHPMMKGTLIIE